MPQYIEQMFETQGRLAVLCIVMSQDIGDVLHQDVGDASGALGGDTSTASLRRWLPTNPLIPMSASPSRGGQMMPRGSLDVPPRPNADQQPWLARPVPTGAGRPAARHPRPEGQQCCTINVDKVFYKIDVEHRFKQVLVITDADQLTITDLQGELLAEHIRPAPGVTYVGNGRPRGMPPKRPQVSPMS